MSKKKRKNNNYGAQSKTNKNSPVKNQSASKKPPALIASAVALVAIIIGVVFAINSCQRSYTVEISVVDYGKITLELDGGAAPKTVENFVSLVNEGFYDGLTFHRVMENFMIQGGDPKANGSGSSSKKIYGEFSENGWNNPISHKRGVSQIVVLEVEGSSPSIHPTHVACGAKVFCIPKDLFFFLFHSGLSPSGKAQDFDSCTRWFESSWPSEVEKHA